MPVACEATCTTAAFVMMMISKPRIDPLSGC